MTSLTNKARRVRDLLYRVRPFECPVHLRENQRSLTEGGEQRLTQALRDSYFSWALYFPDPVETYLPTEEGQDDMRAHLVGRLEAHRRSVIPWIDEAVRLSGASVLEIGCGTGSSTVALAEQGARVVASDVHEGSLRVARDRLDAYGLEAELVCLNASEAFDRLRSSTFDVVAFIGVLEHMTLEERLKSLRDAWRSLPSGGHLVVQETPNRLWYFDDHTSQEEFFLWLPDDLAVRYSVRTPRPRYNRVFKDVDPENSFTRMQFARWGRGISYHEFVLAFDVEPSRLPVKSCLELFLREKTNAGRIYKRTPGRRYEALLRSIRPELDPGFCLRNLDLIFRKP